jgi:hypothetical protein
VNRVKSQKVKVGSRPFWAAGFALAFELVSSLIGVFVWWRGRTQGSPLQEVQFNRRGDACHRPAQHGMFNGIRTKFRREHQHPFRKSELYVRPPRHEILHRVCDAFLHETRELLMGFSMARDSVLRYVFDFSAGVAGEQRFAPTVGWWGRAFAVVWPGEHTVRPYKMKFLPSPRFAFRLISEVP